MKLLLKIIIAVPLFSKVQASYLSNTTDVYFYLYTKEGADGILLTDANKNLFNPTKCTKVIIHGFNVNASIPWVVQMAQKFAQKDCNSIAVDWGKLSETLYIKAALNSKVVAQITANVLITLLYQNKSSNVTYGVKNLHIIGHSVGAHLAGLTGHKMHIKLGTKVKRITGLDPAGPYFDALFTSKTRRINKHDADFVDIIHTDGMFFGYDSDLGHVDFYPNGGRIQPQCAKGNKNGCSHTISHEYFYKSIDAPDYFIGTQCPEWDLYLLNVCKNKPKAPMGIATSPDTRRRYYLKTKYIEN